MRVTRRLPPPLTNRVGSWVRKLVVLGVAASLVVGGVVWFMSGQIYEGALRAPEPGSTASYVDAVVTVFDDSTITLRSRGSDRVARPGIWGVRWPDGYGRLGRILGDGGGEVHREFLLLQRGNLAPGTPVSVDAYAYSGPPRVCLNLPHEDVAIPTPLGGFPAWYVPGRRSTWVILVHGKGGTREEALRAMEIISPMGFPCLAITYRNDPEAAPGANGRYLYGVTEWVDLDAAVRYAIGAGAKDLILVGYSLGGGIVLNFMAQSESASRVNGLILESPCIQLNAALDYGLSAFRLPVMDAPVPPLIQLAAKRTAEIRYGVRWSAFDRAADAARLHVPVLLMHGEDDPVIPIRTSEELARRAPERIRFARFSGAGHVECWNVDRARYRSLVETFLSRRP